MRKKILIGLGLFSLIFILGGTYTIISVEQSIAKLNTLIKLHQVEILREHLLIQVKKVQGDLGLKNTRYAKGFGTLVTDVGQMSGVADTCFDCHHKEDIMRRLTELRSRIELYKSSISRAFLVRAGAGREIGEQENAYKVGEQIIADLDNIIVLSESRLEKRTDQIDREVANTKTAMFVLLVLQPLLIMGLAVIFTKRFTSSIDSLMEATRKVKAGDLNYRINGLEDEFGIVANSFNEMATSVQRMYDELQRTEQISILGQLAAGLAHEIKNPLAGIKAFMEIMSEDSCLPEEDMATLAKVLGEVKRIEYLMKDLLNFARPPLPQLNETSINRRMESMLSIVALSAKKADGREVLIKKELGEGIPPTMADPLQLEQAFLNLLMNALDAMPDGGTLSVKTSYHRPSGSILVIISDTGKGIQPGMEGRIFQPFFTTKAKGTGLGLAITKRLIEQHGGRILAENNPGGGASFKIVLPVQQKSKTEGQEKGEREDIHS